VADGVETQEQADILSSLGCRFFQGFHFWETRSERTIGYAVDVETLGLIPKI
jgi:EAL domain-containing protein (putative c-di-GMP-specific phosphodiesterase class I)